MFFQELHARLLAQVTEASDQAATGADSSLETGAWAGFTLGEARAWCWALFVYEPHGLVHPGSEVRARALQELREGGLPEVFSYPHRAQELRLAGFTPLSFIDTQWRLGKQPYPVGL